jgi:YD repeat-containing protein
MNRQIFNNLTVVAIAIAIAVVFTSCQKDDNDKVKLLETVTEPYGQYRKFEYDSHNRLTKYLKYDSSGELLETRTLTYSGNDLVKVMFNSTVICEYTKSGNKITAIPGTQTWDLNSDGQLVKYVGEIGDESQVIDYQYQNGNMVKETYVYTYESGETFGTISEYKYVDKKSPMYDCTTPQWYLIYSFIDIMISTTNNMTERKWSVDSDTGVVTHEYEYDSDGYPTKRTSTYGNGKEVTDFAYKEL